ncbi:Members of tubulin/FtsZ family domain-containing protein [Dioscorea alata]|uniref:Members of tubulin/FtsZ family domain-containing protein n=1 Tax=Dioscorea alata TaxID=55571 RepID=A0ACB7VHI7_DIOAL|nr:Members of tubulin/FtsZ family domain-containing protein [Dioscorea alata]
MKEIVTIQVGDFSNYIGSHFWNFQDELLGLAHEPDGDPIYKNMPLNMDVLYRAGETQEGIATYCPRLISVGLQGSLGTLSTLDSLYYGIPSPDTSEIITWSGDVSKHISEPRKKNLFLQSLDEEWQGKSTSTGSDAVEGRGDAQIQIQDKDRVECLENGVQYWTDFSKVQYHPRSLFELHGSWTNIQKFDNYGIGKDVLSEGSQVEEMSERLRFFVEECDRIQGIQFVVDDSGGFSSVAATYLEDIADEYPNTPILLYAARSPRSYSNIVSKKESISKCLHDAISFSRLSSLCKLMVPIGLPSLSKSKFSSVLHIEDQKLFHSSAVYAASIHSISIPFRLEMLGPATNSSNAIGAINIGEAVQMLSSHASQNMVCALNVAMPAPSSIDEQRQGSILRSLHSLTPEIQEDAEDFRAVETMIVHGTLYSRGHRASVSQVEDSICASYEHEPQKPLFSHLTVALCPLPIPLPFPSIFKSHVGRHGELLPGSTQSEQPKGSLDINSVPMAARLRSSNAIIPYIQRRLASIQRYGLQRGTSSAELLQKWGFGREEIEDMGEDLSRKIMSFNPHSEMSTDSD